MSRLTKEIRALCDSIGWYRQKLKSADNCFITCSEKTDGTGAQIQAILSTMLFADELAIKYVHTPFKKIGHNINDDKSFESKWESFVNLGFDDLAVDQIKSNKLDVLQVHHPREVKKIENTLFVIPNCHKFADRNPDLYLKLAPQIQHKYAQSSEKPDLYFDPVKINVAIHIRRGDVTQEDSKRYTSNRFVLSITKGISSTLKDLGKEPVFHIYSQGDEEKFVGLVEDGTVFHLNECPFTTFHHMVSADVLVMAKSSFSYSAALFSSGIKIYLPFWHKPLKDWIIVKENGSFNKKKFRNMIKDKNHKSYNR